MATISLVLREDKTNRKGETPIYFRIIKDRKIVNFTTGIKIDAKYWDNKKIKVKASHPNSARFNHFLDSQKVEIQDIILKLESNKLEINTGNIKSVINGTKPSSIKYFEFAYKMIEKSKNEGELGTYDSRRSMLNKFKSFIGRDIVFENISVNKLREYENFLKTHHKNATTTIHRDFKFLRQVFNQAVKEGLVEQSSNPFLIYTVKQGETQRDYLNENELKKFENVKLLTSSKIALARDMYVFSAYAGGIRIGNLLMMKQKNFDGTHLNFTIRKTKKASSIKLPNKCIDIIEQWKTKKTPYLFPFVPENLDENNPKDVDLAISRCTALINKYLKIIAERAEVDKNISFHTSRHTWATRALRKGISIDKVSKILGHKEIKETQIYARIVNEELDKAMDIFNE